MFASSTHRRRSGSASAACYGRSACWAASTVGERGLRSRTGGGSPRLGHPSAGRNEDRRRPDGIRRRFLHAGGLLRAGPGQSGRAVLLYVGRHGVLFRLAHARQKAGQPGARRPAVGRGTPWSGISILAAATRFATRSGGRRGPHVLDRLQGCRLKPRWCLRPDMLQAIAGTGVEVAARQTSYGAETEFKLPWANFPDFKPALNAVIALDAELCYGDGTGHTYRTFAYGSPLSVQQPASQGKVQLVEKLDPADWNSARRDDADPLRYGLEPKHQTFGNRPDGRTAQPGRRGRQVRVPSD